MTDKQKKTVDAMNEYILNVQSRFLYVRDLAIFLPNSTLNFGSADVIERLSDTDKEKLKSYKVEAQQIAEQVAISEEIIQNRMNALIDHVERVKAGTETPADTPQLFLMIYGLFDETLKLAALAMQSVSISGSIAHLLERSNDAALQYIKEVMAELAKINENINDGFTTTAAKLHRVQETIEDQHRHSGELWATIPHCVRAVLDAVEIEKNEGRDMPRPPQFDALRIAVQRRLASKGKRARKSTKGTFYPVADIAEVLAEEYRGFSEVQYIREFEPFGLQEKDLPPVHKA